MHNILLIGESCIDIFTYGMVNRLSPEGPAPVFIPLRETKNGGMAKNVEANLDAFGCTVDLITNQSEIVKQRLVHDASNTLFIRIDMNDSVQRITPELLRSIDYDKYDMVVISDYNKGFLHEDDIEYVSQIHDNVICDTKKKLGNWCRFLKFIKVNRGEYESNKDFIENNTWILKKLLITLDKDGCKYLDTLYETKKVDIIDISGAGDTFVAGFVIKYLATKSIPDSIMFGNNCASQVVQKRGVAVVVNSNLI